MKKLILFFAGFLVMLLMFAALFLVGAIYDTEKKIEVETYFFQTNDNFNQRLAEPATVKDIGTAGMRDMLITKFVTEYFYVIPDEKDVQNRMDGNTPLNAMSTEAVFKKWTETIAPKLQEMAKKKMLRLVSVLSITPETATEDFWRVDYELKTWNKPNDITEVPVVERNVLFLKLFYEPGFREELRKKTLEEFLEDGGDPSIAFTFGIYDVTTY